MQARRLVVSIVIAVAATGLIWAAASDYDAKRAAMVERLREQGIRGTRLLSAMGKVPRHLFVNEAQRDSAYDDVDVRAGAGQVMLDPHTTALMTQALRLKRDDKVLEIGTGPGYQTALLAELAGSVLTLEDRRPVWEATQSRLRTLGYTSVRCKLHRGCDGWVKEAPFNAILVTRAVERVEQSLIDQLAEGGRLVVPVGNGPEQTLNLMQKVRGRLRVEAVGKVRVPSVQSGRADADSLRAAA